MKNLKHSAGAVICMIFLGIIINRAYAHDALTLTIAQSPDCPQGSTIHFIDNNNAGFVNTIQGTDCDGNLVNISILDKFGLLLHRDCKFTINNNRAHNDFSFLFIDSHDIPVAVIEGRENADYLVLEPLPTAYYELTNKIIFGMSEIDLTEFPNYDLSANARLKVDFVSTFDLAQQRYDLIYENGSYAMDFFVPNIAESSFALDAQDFATLYEKDYGLLEPYYEDFYKSNQPNKLLLSDFDFNRIDFTTFYSNKSVEEFLRLVEQSNKEFNLSQLDFESFMRSEFDERNFAVYNIFAFNLSDQDFKQLYCKDFKGVMPKTEKEFELCRQVIEDAIKAQFSNEQLEMLEKYSNITNDFEKEYLRVTPNPVSSTANIFYEVDKPARVLIRIYSSLGNEEAVVIDEFSMAGSKQISYNVLNLPNGVYVLQMIIDSKVISTRMIVAN